MQQLFIHIGLPKTGSTALQRFLHHNRETLSGLGYLYPGKNPAHHYIRYNWTDKTDSVLLAKSQNMFREIREKPNDRIIISSETMSASNENIPHTLKNLVIEELGDDLEIKIIVYLRRQDHWLESRYVQNIKTTYSFVPESLKKMAFPEFLRSHRKFYNLDYYRRLEPWAGIFGETNIMVRPYEKDQFVGGSISSDFLHTIGISSCSQFSQPDKTNFNTGLSPDAVEIVRLYNKYLKSVYFKNILCNSLLRRTSSKQPFSTYTYLSPRQRFDLLSEYDESNARIAREYLCRNDGRLFYEEWPDPAGENDGHRRSSEESCKWKRDLPGSFDEDHDSRGRE